MFIEINDKMINLSHVGDIIPDSLSFTITYIFLGGRKETESFDSLDPFNSRLNYLKSL